jgi:fumarate reductase flavoprotein subunit
MNVEFDIEVDVLVIGAGGCGLVAAIAADDAGAKTAVLEKLERPGGNTSLSSGSIPGAGTRFQAAAGVTDDALRFRADLMRVSGAHDAPHVEAVLAERSAELVEWLVDCAGVNLELVETYRHVGHSVARLHAPPSRDGADLVRDLERTVEERGIPVACGQPAVRLLVSDDRVIGAQTRDRRSETTLVGARSVILASNGFGANRPLLAEMCPLAVAAQYAGAIGSEGEALTWGQELRAATGNTAAFQGHAALASRNGALVTWTVVERGAVIVDCDGRRIADETIGYSAFAARELAARGPFHMIYDTRIANNVRAGQPSFEEVCQPGVMIVAETLQDLATRLDLDAATLQETIADASQAVAGAEDAFTRRDWGLGALVPPFCATRIEPALFHTQGGLMVDSAARVLRDDGTPINGLFAGGGAAVGISGRSGSDGYTSGNGLLSALGLGYIAGRTAGQEALHVLPPRPVTLSHTHVQHGG